jgi:hypothetical protein
MTYPTRKNNWKFLDIGKKKKIYLRILSVLVLVGDFDVSSSSESSSRFISLFDSTSKLQKERKMLSYNQ